MPSNYEKKYDKFMEGWTGKDQATRDKEEKERKNRFKKIKKFFGMNDDNKENG